MTEFRPECTINLHVESQGKPAKLAWSCSIAHHRSGRVACARKFLGIVPREEAELHALLFGLEQAKRLLQEKVEIAAAFSLKELLEGEARGARGMSPERKAMREGARREWETFRLRRISPLGREEQAFLRDLAEGAYRRRRNE